MLGGGWQTQASSSGELGFSRRKGACVRATATIFDGILAWGVRRAGRLAANAK